MDKDMEDADKRYEWLHSEHSSAAGDIFGESQTRARIGDEYQAQIPSFMEQENEQLVTCQDRFRIGLSIPVVWIHNHHKSKKTAKGKSGILGSGRDSSLVPGSSSESWTTIEHDSFLLGLYIFGKNLGLVNKFVGNKGMRNVLCHYYGKFYRSGEHQKWSMFRKKRSRKSVPGKKIFNGWRRHELLSRLLPNLTDECKTSLTQVTRRFEEERISFEKYVLSVRDTVGVNLLVEAIGIGEGKRDLTGRANKKAMKNKKLKTTTTLKAEEIVSLVKDGIGVSKERLKDIFWEAVWPRLLARGWHSEQQPQPPRLHSSKQPLVFLAPGVPKFSRRSLEKGTQYFDSLTDLLNKVASEPWLLERGPHQDDRLAEVQQQDDDLLMKCTVVDTSSAAGVVGVREVPAVPHQSSDANHHHSPPQVAVGGPVVSEGKPVVRKLKLVCKPIAKHQDHNTDKLRGEDEDEDLLKKNKSQGIVIDLNNPRVGPESDAAVLMETATNQLPSHGGGQRQSTRNRPLSTKALEALANGFLSPTKKKKRGGEDKERMRRRVRAKTALVSTCGSPYIQNRVDGSPSCMGMGMGMVTQSKMN